MSPYQQQVLIQLLQSLILKQQKVSRNLQPNAIAAGAFGGGREGVLKLRMHRMQHQIEIELHFKQNYYKKVLVKRINLAAKLLNQQRNLASLQPSLAASNVQQLGAAGTGNLAYQQALLDAQQQQAQLAYNEPFSRLGFMDQG
jgi:hypothetical protein